MIRTGQGIDFHRISTERKLILGGVQIQCGFGLEGHSDADVLVHAIMDALIGSLALGDIGKWFPDTDPSFKDASSIGLLSRIIESKEFGGWEIVNIDSTVIAEKPKIATFIHEMRDNIARTCKIAPENVSVKATTTEKLGFCGRGEGIAAMAVVLVECKEQ